MNVKLKENFRWNISKILSTRNVKRISKLNSNPSLNVQEFVVQFFINVIAQTRLHGPFGNNRDLFLIGSGLGEFVLVGGGGGGNVLRNRLSVHHNLHERIAVCYGECVVRFIHQSGGLLFRFKTTEPCPTVGTLETPIFLVLSAIESTGLMLFTSTRRAKGVLVINSPVGVMLYPR